MRSETAIVYTRKSTVSEGRSLREQEADLRLLAERHGLDVVDVLREEQSAYAERERPRFVEALRRCEAERHVLLTWSIDRFSRQGADEIVRVLPRKGRPAVRLLTYDGRDSADPNQRLSIIIDAETARQYSERLSAHVSRAKRADRAAGRWLGGTAPYGYRVTPDRKIEPDPATAPIMRRIVDAVLDGKTLIEVARELNADRVPVPGKRRNGAGEWRSSAISHMLRSPALVGWLPQGSGTGEFVRDDDGNPVSVIADGAEPLVTPAERRRIADQLGSRQRPNGRPTGRQAKSLLAGRIYCGACLDRMASMGTVYRCQARFLGSARCPGNTVGIAPADRTVTARVLDGLTRLAQDYRHKGTIFWDDRKQETLEAIAATWVAEHSADVVAERRAAEEGVETAEAALAELEDAHWLRKEFAGREERYEAIRVRLSAQLVDARRALDALGPPPAVSLDDLVGILLAGKQRERSEEDQRRLVKLSLESVYVAPATTRGGRFDTTRITVALVGGGIIC